jgi:hypothetical protein
VGVATNPPPSEILSDGYYALPTEKDAVQREPKKPTIVDSALSFRTNVSQNDARPYDAIDNHSQTTATLVLDVPRQSPMRKPKAKQPVTTEQPRGKEAESFAPITRKFLAEFRRL